MTSMTEASIDRSHQNMEQQAREAIASLWWFPFIRGIMLVIFGLIMYAWPGATLVSLVTFMGGYWLVGGVFDLVEGIVGRTYRSRIWLIIGGLVSILGGFLVIAQPVLAGLMTATFVVTLLGIAAVATGVFYIVAGNAGNGLVWRNVLLGVLYIIFGLIILFNPLLTEAVMLWMLPLWAIVTGVFSIIASFMVRRIDNPA